MKYSVVLPAYNAEKTIERCLNSLLACGYQDVEIIVVNDGSRDGTDDICRHYAEVNPGIRYFSKENGGVSSARNLGLSQVQGDYVTFVDSDDFVSPAYFSTLDAHLTDDCDFLMFGKAVFNGSKTIEYPLYNSQTDNAADTAVMMSSALVQQQLNAPVTKVFRRSLIEAHQIRFDERLTIGEDKVFVVQYIIHIQNAVFIKDPLYTVSVENRDSLSRKKRMDLCDHILLEHQLLFEAADCSRHRVTLKKAVSYSYYRSAYTVIRELYKFDYSRHQRLEQTVCVCKKYGVRKDCTYLNFRHWLISIPIRLRLVGLIDLVLRKKR